MKRFAHAFGYIEVEGKPNQLLNKMEKDGTTDKLIEIFNNNKYKDKNIKT